MKFTGKLYKIIRVFILSSVRTYIYVARRRNIWQDNSKMDLQEVGGSRGDWMELAQDRDRWRTLVGTVRNFRVP
jgi:hypothetical protein